jgi:hypothetical protein
LLLLVGLVVLMTVLVRGWSRRRRRSDAQAAAQLASLRSVADPHSGVYVVHVRSVYQRGRGGAKAWIVFEGFSELRDSWFWHSPGIAAGQVLAVTPQIGYGPHTRREGVVFIGDKWQGTGIRAALPAHVVKAADRHHERARYTNSIG